MSLCFAPQDVVWMPKCLNYGWFLPYKPPDNEFGGWKKYYLGCVQTPDYRPALDFQVSFSSDVSCIILQALQIIVNIGKTYIISLVFRAEHSFLLL